MAANNSKLNLTLNNVRNKLNSDYNNFNKQNQAFTFGSDDNIEVIINKFKNYQKSLKNNIEILKNYGIKINVFIENYKQKIKEIKNGTQTSTLKLRQVKRMEDDYIDPLYKEYKRQV